MAHLNTTVNGTLPSTCNYISNSIAEKVGKSLAYSLIIIVSLAGNFFVAAIVFKTKTMRKTINYFIVNMALSDLLLPIFAFPRLLTELYVDEWLIDGHLGETLCKLVYFLQDTSNAVSILTLVLIAVDRFVAVVFPFRRLLISSRRCRYFILATWVVGMGIHLPYFFARKLFVVKGTLECKLLWEEAFGESSSLRNYFVALFLVLAVIPFALMTLLYSIIIYKLKTHKLPGGTDVNIKEQQRRDKRDRNVLKMVVAIVLVFALCWAPYNVFAFLRFFVWDETNAAPKCGFVFFALYMAFANCAINPCICFLFSENYRDGLKKLLGCCPQKCNCSCIGAIRGQSWNVAASSGAGDTTMDIIAY